jgi:hypothetical protein
MKPNLSISDFLKKKQKTMNQKNPETDDHPNLKMNSSSPFQGQKLEMIWYE